MEASAALPSRGMSNPPSSSVSSLDFEHLRASVSQYLRAEDVGRIEAAYHFSADAHSGQFRASGEPYVSHPVAVATILSEWHLDAQALIAALLHDVMEDTAITKTQIGEHFGRIAADLVDGVSKLDRIEFQSQREAQAENFRKMLLAMASDLRVILIKLADRLHNMRTLECVRPEKRRRVARETLEIYAPIANRLGLHKLFHELQELSFQHLYPLRYRVLAKAVKSARGNRREGLGRILRALRERLRDTGVDAEVGGREKHLFSIYRKMLEKHLTFSQVMDIFGFRVVVANVPSCYLALGMLHGLFKPVPGKFKDYIAIPKANGYRSLHTTLIGPYGMPIEVQIRTREMDHIAETGVASHWLYKEDASLSDLQQMTHKWLQSLLELQTASGDSTEFLEHVKIDLFPDEVYVFTPKGRILALPRGSTPVDFAYAVHTDIGNRCVACRINQEFMPLRTDLKNGDQVEIITAPHAVPNPAWLTYAKTGKARSQIRHFLKTQQNEESAELGERLLARAMEEAGHSLDGVEPATWEKMLRDAGARNRTEIFSDIGLGKRLAAVVARRLLVHDETQQEDGEPPGSVVIRGSEGMAVQFASCCRPIPGDPIIGSIKKGQGLVVHTHDCGTIRKSRSQEPEKWIDVEWDPEPGRLFDVRIGVHVENRRGVLAKVASAIAECGSNIDNVGMEADGGFYTTLFFTVQVADRIHLARVMRQLRRVPRRLGAARRRHGTTPTLRCPPRGLMPPWGGPAAAWLRAEPGWPPVCRVRVLG
ncbi:MAG: bifunctional (p)ppGpp synthetase/guanosine-3',5'-bis(diphosphate) 3'-pyrophosphohydrolase [Betaproteobacteria bacterium]|nr:bifunctional (p)ppGpp synthetase/guanosine-3',5'-bis(diphosphate) 3'-pyrophosphohydrolase [Betaproteobacteria bacterium]